MELQFLKATPDNLSEIMTVYSEVIKTTFTTWNKNYPSKELIAGDIANGNLYVLKNNDNIIAVSFLGAKEQDSETWQIPLTKPLGIARICVSPKFQSKGIGTAFVKHLINEAKTRCADGMHFHVCTTNVSAIKMYEKAGFKNCGQGQSNYGFDYYKFEQKF